MTPRTLNCQVTAVEDLTPDVFRVRLEGRAEAMAHAPGQFLELKLDDDTWVPLVTEPWSCTSSIGLSSRIPPDYVSSSW